MPIKNMNEENLKAIPQSFIDIYLSKLLGNIRTIADFFYIKML